MSTAYTVSPTITLPNITVEEKYIDGVLKAHRLTAHDGYVMYDTLAENYEPADPMNPGGEQVRVNYYFRQATIPIRVPFENWGWVAVLESEVDENYIFGGDTNKPEVM